jgi:hypothetical protein
MENNFIHWNTQVTTDELLGNLPQHSPAAFLKYVYEKEAAQYGKRVICIKENTMYKLLNFVLANFDRPKFVYMVRDPRDMGLSWKKINWWRGGDTTPGVREGVHLWKENQVDSIRAFTDLRDSGKITLIRYEDILRNMESELRRLCDFLELPYDAAMTEFYKTDKAVYDAQASQAFRNLAKPLIGDNFNKYKTELSETEIRWVEQYCGHEMRLLGYETDYDDSIDMQDLEKEIEKIEQELMNGERPFASEEETEKRQKRFEALERIFTRPEISI